MADKIRKKDLGDVGYTVPNYLYKEKQVRYYSDFFIKIALSRDGKKWEDLDCTILAPNKDSFDHNPLTIMGAVLTTAGIMIIYDSSKYEGNPVHLRVGIALFDPNEPMKLIWRSESPLYQYEFETDKLMTPELAVQDKEELVLTWILGSANKIEVRIPHPYLYLGDENKRKLRTTKRLEVNRYKNNPIIEPLHENGWETKATFNPAALFAGERIHLMYRAIGRDDMSVLGYISSENGFDMDERLDHPVYFNRKKQDKKLYSSRKSKKSPLLYVSGGGGNGGCEDPRLTLIDDVVYLTYTSFDGWGSLRMALSSISLKDFLNKEWNWKKPIHISPPGEVHKNWVLFPEKIGGKFAVLHSINPSIAIDYLNDLEFKGEKKYIKSFFSGLKNKGRWDSWVRGVGPPPIKTDKGWLIIYHAMDVYSDPNRYKLGAMLLDLNNPQKVIARSKEPILEPDECYENDGWKAGVAYSCGAVEKDGQLLIYYGGADTVSCVAETNLNEFISKLIETERPKIKVYAKHKQVKSP